MPALAGDDSNIGLGHHQPSVWTKTLYDRILVGGQITAGYHAILLKIK